jgi:nitrate/nitrite transporter NarK
MMLPSAWAVCMDLGGKYAGAVSGAMNSFGHIGGSLCAFLVGHLVQTLGSYNAPLVVIAANVALAAVLFAFIDASKPLVADEEEAAHAPPVAMPRVEASPCA